MSSETSQSSLMDFNVPAVKKLPSSSSLATKLTNNGVAEFITRDLRPVSVVDGVGFITRIIKTFSIKMKEDVARDVKTQKACEQGWEVNVGPKIKQTTSI